MKTISISELVEYYNGHSTAETCQFLGISKARLYQLLTKHKIPRKGWASNQKLAIRKGVKK